MTSTIFGRLWQTIGAWEDYQGDNIKLLYKGFKEYKFLKDPKTQTKGKAEVLDFIAIALKHPWAEEHIILATM